jgi:hypothetical protein
MTMGLSRMTPVGGFGPSTLIVFLQSVQIVKVCTGKPLSAQEDLRFHRLTIFPSVATALGRNPSQA